MKQLEGQVRIPSGCAVSAVISREGKRMDGQAVIESMKPMHDRSNGLGGGFAGYGIYPELRDYFALHLFFRDHACRKECEAFLKERFDIVLAEEIPVRKLPEITDEPLIWRYFAAPLRSALRTMQVDEKEFVVRTVMRLNAQFPGTYVFSCGKNMGVFKGVGYPEDIGRFYRLEEYRGYCWTAHGRYPTNTPGWWGGAHPFTLLDWSIVHNGEISSYDANRRYVEQFGYHCNLQTDTEVITYLFDLLVRRQGLRLDTAASILAAPEWEVIDRMPKEAQDVFTALRATYSGALINGPFSILVGSKHGLLALNDRLKLRSLITAEKGSKTYFASEESAIRVICPDPEKIMAVEGGTPVFIPFAQEADAK